MQKRLYVFTNDIGRLYQCQKVREFEIADGAETFIKEKYCDVARRRRRKIWVRTGIWKILESRTEPPPPRGGGVSSDP